MGREGERGQRVWNKLSLLQHENDGLVNNHCTSTGIQQIFNDYAIAKLIQKIKLFSYAETVTSQWKPNEV